MTVTLRADSATEGLYLMEAEVRPGLRTGSLADIEVFAFPRNWVVEAGTVLPRTAVDTWIVPDQPRRFALPRSVASAIPSA